MYENEKIRSARRVLVVEDNEINREMLKMILEENYEVLEAENGAQGMQLLKENFRTLSLILLDVQMPVMDGYEFLRIQREDELLRSVPVIVTTGSTISEDEERCLTLGATDFVTKPYNPRVIVRRVEAIIRLHESITELQEIEFDALTGLYTRNAFYHHAKDLFQSADGKLDMMMLNLEDFSYLNERYERYQADELLKHIGKCIRKNLPDALLSSRLKEDRFVILREHRDTDDRETVAELDRILHENAPIPDFRAKFAVYREIPTDTPAGVLCTRLSLALKTIKHRYQENLAVYDRTMSEKFDRIRRIQNSMEDALQESQFLVYYQPKHDVRTGKIAGAEALVRWFHPEYGFMSPGDFVPFFEENGFIAQLDLYIWRTVCRDIRHWQELGLQPVPISVNVSRHDFLARDCLEKVLQLIRESGVDRELLHVEITESLGISDKVILEKAKEIRDAGIRIELDDFGSGQSSLSSLVDIPMDVVKMDMSFARSLDRQKEVVRMIISLAHALGCEVVAEGVETEEQINTLRSMGCDLIQGFYYSGPMPESDFEEYLRKQNRETAV